MLSGSGHFVVDVTERPDTLNYQSYKEYDAVVSNWNSWPDNDKRWTAEAETGLLQYVSEGGGLVFFHASTSALYSWPEFKLISTGAWVNDTWHGKIGPVKVEIENREHIVTKGLANFSILDELWINAESNENFQVLGSAINLEGEDKTSENQPAVFVLEYGRGRVFHTLLGHDVRAMRNTGFQTLFLRGTEWASKAEVTIPVPREMQVVKSEDKSEFFWVENDRVFALCKNGQILWQFNYKNRFGRPFFHPV
jgi:type 1 glutamine amidotransferase